MRPEEEAQQAWVLWQMLTDMSDRLWKFYENEFFEFYAEDEGDDWMKNDGNS